MLKPTESEQKQLSHVRLFATPWTIESMEFSRPEYWIGFPSPGYLPNPEIETRSSTLQVDSLPAEPPGKFYHREVVLFNAGMSNGRAGL